MVAAVVEDRGRGGAGIGVGGEIDLGAVKARAVPFARRGFGGRRPKDGQDDEIGPAAVQRMVGLVGK